MNDRSPLVLPLSVASGVEIRRVVYSPNAIEFLHARMRRTTRANGHFPDEQAALKCLDMVVRSLDPTGVVEAGRGWMSRWKPPRNPFVFVFEGRLRPAGD